jgi:undecaprenyl-diphosphatase
MNSFDISVIHFLNSFARRWLLFDEIIVFVRSEDLFAGAIPLAMFWYAWAHYAKENIEKRRILLCGLGNCILALMAARLLAFTLPFRQRPIFEPLLRFQIPFGGAPVRLEMIGWSAFPSDHAAVFFCLVVSLWMASRRLGIVATVYFIFALAFPLLYVGQHYPTDLIAGCVLGTVIACLSRIPAYRTGVTKFALEWMDKYAGSFYAFLFLCTFEVSELFHSVKDIGLNALKVLRLMH